MKVFTEAALVLLTNQFLLQKVVQRKLFLRQSHGQLAEGLSQNMGLCLHIAILIFYFGLLKAIMPLHDS